MILPRGSLLLGIFYNLDYANYQPAVKKRQKNPQNKIQNS